MQGRRFADRIEKKFVGVTVAEGEVEVAMDRVAQGAGAAERGEKIFSGLQAESLQDVVAVTVTLVHRGGGRAGRFGHGTHGQRFFAAAGPQTRSGGKDALFQFGIGMTGQISSRSRFKVSIRRIDLLLVQRIVNAVYYTYT